MKTKLLLLFVAIPLFLTHCITKDDLEMQKEKLLQTDIDFSNRSVEVGNHQAFLEFASPDAVLLKPNSHPIIGKNAMKQLYAELSDTNYRLTWKPSFARVSKSADLGYTFGIFLLEVTMGEQKGQFVQGTYCTIWGKNIKGEWRFVLDTGNSGLKPKTDEE